jgi:hypothetical protein
VNHCAGQAQECRRLIGGREPVPLCGWFRFLHDPNLFPLTPWTQFIKINLFMTQIDAIDELRVNDRFFSRVLVNRWPKPESVRLLLPSRYSLSELPGLSNSNLDARLEFSWHWKGPTIDSPTPVKPPRDLVDMFMKLGDADEARIQAFAERYGGLFVFCEMRPSEDRLIVTESCEVWRYFARSIQALLRIATTINRPKAGAPNDWDQIGCCPPAVKKPPEASKRDLLSPIRYPGEEAWPLMAHFIRKGDRDWRMWTRLLNCLLDLGRVRPFVHWDRSSNERSPYLLFGTPSLFSHIAFQACLLATRREGVAVCSYCRASYQPRLRAPKAKQRNFCPACKEKRVPARLWQRDHRAKLKTRKESRPNHEKQGKKEAPAGAR